MKIVSLFTKNVFLLVNIFPFLPLGTFFLISGCGVHENPYNSVKESIWGYKRTLVQGGSRITYHRKLAESGWCYGIMSVICFSLLCSKCSTKK